MGRRSSRVQLPRRLGAVVIGMDVQFRSASCTRLADPAILAGEIQLISCDFQSIDRSRLAPQMKNPYYRVSSCAFLIIALL